MDGVFDELCDERADNQRKRDEAMRIANHRMRSVLDELIMNADGVAAGRLAHFSKKEFAQAVADRARWALLPNGTTTEGESR